MESSQANAFSALWLALPFGGIGWLWMLSPQARLICSESPIQAPKRRQLLIGVHNAA
jgi:hypothetical protein